MKIVLLWFIALPFFKKSASNTEAYLRAREYLSSKKYEEAGRIADSLIQEGYKDKDVFHLLMYSLYQRAMWDSIVSLSRRFKDFRLPAKSQEYSDVMFMTAVAYLKQHNVALSIYYIVKSATSSKNRDRAQSFVKNYIGMSDLPQNLPYKWLLTPQRPAIIDISDSVKDVQGDFMNGFILGLSGSIPYVQIKSLKDIKNASLLIGPMLSQNVAKSYAYLQRIFEPTLFPLSEDVRFTLTLPLFPLNRRYAVEITKGVALFADKLGYMNYAVYYEENDPVALSAKFFLEKELSKRGLYIAFETGFTEDSISIISEIDSTTGENWDAVFVLGRSDFALTLATTFRREVEDLPVFIFSDFKWKVVQGGYVGLNGVIFAGYYSGERKMLDLLSRKQRFQDLYNAQFGTYPSYFAQRGYDVGNLLKKMATEIDTFNRKNVINYLYNMGVYEGISGYFLFRDDPSLIKVYTFKNGRVVEYKEE